MIEKTGNLPSIQGLGKHWPEGKGSPEGGGTEGTLARLADEVSLVEVSPEDYTQLGLEILARHRLLWLLRAGVEALLALGVLGPFYPVAFPMALFWLASAPETMRHLLVSGLQAGPRELLRSAQRSVIRVGSFSVLVIGLLAVLSGTDLTREVPLTSFSFPLLPLSFPLQTVLGLLWFHGITELLLRSGERRPNFFLALGAGPRYLLEILDHWDLSNSGGAGFSRRGTGIRPLLSLLACYLALPTLPPLAFYLGKSMTIRAWVSLCGSSLGTNLALFSGLVLAALVLDTLTAFWCLQYLSFQEQLRQWRMISEAIPPDGGGPLPCKQSDALAVVLERLEKTSLHFLPWSRGFRTKNAVFWTYRALLGSLAFWGLFTAFSQTGIHLPSLALDALGSGFLFGIPTALWVASSLDGTRKQLESQKPSIRELPSEVLAYLHSDPKEKGFLLLPPVLLLAFTRYLWLSATGFSLPLGLIAVLSAWACWLMVVIRMRVSRKRTLGELLGDLPSTVSRMIYFPRGSQGRPEPGLFDLIKPPIGFFLGSVSVSISTFLFLQWMTGSTLLAGTIGLFLGASVGLAALDLLLGDLVARMLALEVERQDVISSQV